MSWWSDAIYDTCSLITLDKILLDHPEMEYHFQGIRAIEASFWADQLRRDVAARMWPRATRLDAPATPKLTDILTQARLPKSLTQTDKLLFATAIHHGLTAITGDKDLAKAVIRKGLRAGNLALVLKTLVTNRKLSEAECNAILADLAKRHDYILPQRHPQTWETLQHYTFP